MNEQISQNRGLYIFESIIFILSGILAIAIPGLFTYSIEILLGILFIAGGVAQGIRTLSTGKGAGYVGSLISSLLLVIVGVLLLAYPITGIITLTLLIACIFFIQGIVQIYIGFEMRELKGWGWMVFSGFVSLILAWLIWSELPGSAAWVIGLLVGINLLIFGFSQLFLILGTDKPSRS